jgi:hypothetical protein
MAAQPSLFNRQHAAAAAADLGQAPTFRDAVDAIARVAATIDDVRPYLNATLMSKKLYRAASDLLPNYHRFAA